MDLLTASFGELGVRAQLLDGEQASAGELHKKFQAHVRLFSGIPKLVYFLVIQRIALTVELSRRCRQHEQQKQKRASDGPHFFLSLENIAASKSVLSCSMRST